MEPFSRPEKQSLLKRFSEQPQWMTLVTGPRQCGKTTLVQQALADLGWSNGYIAIDEPTHAALDTGSAFRDIDENETTLRGDRSRDEAWLTRTWVQARAGIERGEGAPVLALDEIQKIPNWSETVKGLWDDDRRRERPLHVVLLGSSPLLVQKGVSESLAGRYETIRLSHWSFPEMSRAFRVDLPSYVYFGGYPGAASLVRDEERWRAYILGSLVEPNIESDILAMERVDKPALLKQLFELAVLYSGQILSYTKLLGQLQEAGNTTTLARYLTLLSNAGLVTGLQKYTGSALRRRASSPKLLVLNTALMSASSEYTFEQAKADRSHWGRLVESAVGAHLHNTLTPGISLHYWRENSLEVDYVLQRGRQLLSIEVKSGRRKPNLRGIAAFSARYGTLKEVIVGEGGVPLEEFLSIPAGAWFEIP